MFLKMDHPCFEHFQTCFMELKNTDLSFNMERICCNPAKSSNNRLTLLSRIQSTPCSASLDKNSILDLKLSLQRIAISTHFSSNHQTIGNVSTNCRILLIFLNQRNLAVVFRRPFLSCVTRLPINSIQCM